MSDSELDPHVLISCRAAENPKIVDLPSDRARWGWVILMGKAKLQRPAGRFASERVASAVLGDHRRFLSDYLRVGVLERETNLCEHCSQLIPPDDRKPAGLAVHDWMANQSRTQKWRRRVGLTSGHESLSGETPEPVGETDGETSGKHPRAGARATQSQLHIENHPESTTEDRARETRDSAVALHERTGSFPTTKVLAWLDELAEAHGDARLTAAIDRTPQRGANLTEYLRAVRDVLRLEDHNAERAERDAEKARAAHRPRPTVLRQRPAEISDEEADRLARQFREGATA